MNYNEKGRVEKYKTSLDAKGLAQEPDIDYGETFSPAARLDRLRTILAIVAQKH